jgi:hypothetical protein
MIISAVALIVPRQIVAGNRAWKRLPIVETLYASKEPPCTMFPVVRSLTSNSINCVKGSAMKNLLMPFCLMILSASLIASALLIRNGLLTAAERAALQPASVQPKSVPVIYAYYPLDYRIPSVPVQPMPQTCELSLPTGTISSVGTLDVEVSPLQCPLNQWTFQNYGTMDLIAPPTIAAPATVPAK